MAQCRRQLRAAYRFPGFVPSAEVPGFFGAPQARSAGLRRRRKDGLRPVGNAVAQFLRSTSLGGGALCPAACGTSPWSLRSGGVACPHCGVKREKRDGLADNPCSMRNGWPIPSADAVGTRRSRPAPKNWMGIGRRSRSWTNSRCVRSCAGGLPNAAGDRHRRGVDPHGAYLADHRQRLAASPTDLVGRPGPRGAPATRRSSSPSFTLCGLWARRWIKCARANTPA